MPSTIHPKTGDTTNLIIPALLLAGSAAGLTAVIRRKRSTDIYGGMANAVPPKIQTALRIEKGVI